MRKRQRRSSFYRGESSQPHVDETTPLIAFSDNKNGESKKKKPLRPQPSLMKILFKTFGLELVRGQIWKLFYDALILSNPLVLGSVVFFFPVIFSFMLFYCFVSYSLWKHSWGFFFHLCVTYVSDLCVTVTMIVPRVACLSFISHSHFMKSMWIFVRISGDLTSLFYPV